MEPITIAVIIGGIIVVLLLTLLSIRAGLRERKEWTSYKGRDLPWRIKLKIHKTWTEDGYALQIFHIRDPDKHIVGLNPVIMHHNLGGSAENWLFQGSYNSPAAILAQQG